MTFIRFWVKCKYQTNRDYIWIPIVPFSSSVFHERKHRIRHNIKRHKLIKSGGNQANRHISNYDFNVLFSGNYGKDITLSHFCLPLFTLHLSVWYQLAACVIRFNIHPVHCRSGVHWSKKWFWYVQSAYAIFFSSFTCCCCFSLPLF